jgi:hypothetical protein
MAHHLTYIAMLNHHVHVFKNTNNLLLAVEAIVVVLFLLSW